MERDILVSDVSISTLAVEVKVMKIGSRQVTQSVFKQLPDKQIIDFSTGKLLGTPWGRVNYHPDCEKGVLPHFHIVWDDGKGLYRTSIKETWEYPGITTLLSLHYDLEEESLNPSGKLHKAVEAFLYSRLLEGWMPEEKDFPTDQYQRRVFPFTAGEGSPEFTFYTEYCTWTSVMRPLFFDALESKRAWLQKRKQYSYRIENGFEVSQDEQLVRNAARHATNLRDRLVRWLDEGKYPHDSSSIYEHSLLPLYEEYQLYLKELEQTYKYLEQLDQLFIAV